MKKLFCVLAAMLFVFGILSAGVVNVTAPVAGIPFCIGDTVNIVWHETPKDHADVKIRLFDQSLTVQILQINNSTPNDGSYNWVIPTSIPPGQYSLLVKTLDNQEFDFSGIITISNCTPQGSIDVTKPGNNTSFNTPGSCPIQWNSTGTVTGPLKVGLFNSTGSTFVRSINNNVTINGSLNWAIPNDVGVGSYKIKVQTQNESITGVSEMFSISKIITTFRPVELQAVFISTPDLKITITCSPESPAYMQNTNVRFKVENIGSGNSKATNIRVFMGQANTDTWPVPILKPGRSYSMDKKLNPPGVGYIAWSADVDHNNAMGDTNRANNYAKKKMIVKGPDLVVCFLRSTRPSLAKKGTIRAYVRNSGPVKSTPCKLNFYLKNKGTSTFDIPGLNPGEVFKVSRTEKWFTLGNKKVSITIDPGNTVAEENEKNNHVEDSVKVIGPFATKYTIANLICSNGKTGSTLESVW